MSRFSVIKRIRPTMIRLLNATRDSAARERLRNTSTVQILDRGRFMNILHIISLIIALFCLVFGLIELVAATRLNYRPFLLEGIGLLFLGVSFITRTLYVPSGVTILSGGLGVLLIAIFRYKYEDDRRSREITIWKLFQRDPLNRH